MYMLNMVIILIVMYSNVVTAIDKIPTYLLRFNSSVTNERSDLVVASLLRYCRNVRPTWVRFNSKDTKESEWVFEVLSTKSKKRT